MAEKRIVIDDVAIIPSDNDHMRKRLAFIDFSTESSYDIVRIMNEAGIFNDHNLVEGQCKEIKTDKYAQFFGAYSDEQKTDIKVICMNVEKVAHKNYDKEVDALAASLTNFITNAVVKMAKNEIVNPASNFFASIVGDKVTDTLQDIQDKIFKGVESKVEQTAPANDNKPPKKVKL